MAQHRGVELEQQRDGTVGFTIFGDEYARVDNEDSAKSMIDGLLDSDGACVAEGQDVELVLHGKRIAVKAYATHGGRLAVVVAGPNQRIRELYDVSGL